MKIGIFAYNFKHKKTQEGLIKLFIGNAKMIIEQSFKIFKSQLITFARFLSLAFR